MKFSYNWLQSFFDKKLPKPSDLAEFLSLRAFEVEIVQKKDKDFVFDIDVTANRPDCFSHLGIAKEISAILGFKLKEPENKLKAKGEMKVEIEIQNKDDCPCYIARIINNVKIKPSKKYIQERLKVCGVEPINNIVDAANYVMLETAQPLHAFDFDKIKGEKIIVRRGKKKEKIIGLDENKYELDKDILVIADSQKPLAIAGIKGGKSVAIDKGTKTILLEAANFNPVLIRRASQKLNLRTDASMRFEHDLDQNLTIKAIDRLTYLIEGDATKRIDKCFEKVEPRKIKFDLDKANKLLGININKSQARKILASLGFEVNPKFEVKIPSVRRDINIQEDLVEELGRIYGYENLTTEFPSLALVPAKRNEDIFWEEKAKDFLKQANFTELYNYSFISKNTGDNFGGPLVELENPYSEGFYYLRPNLLLNLLGSLKKNRKYSDEKFKFFEIGKIFRRDGGAIKEINMLAGIITAKTDGFYILKGIIEFLLNSFGISEIFYDNFEANPEKSKMLYWDLKRAAEIKVDNKEIGFFGAVSQIALKHLQIKEDVFAFEIDLAKLIQSAQEENEYQPVLKYPAAIRDIALLVPKDVRVGDVLIVINSTIGNLLKDVDLFDIYEGEGLPEGKKNLAFHLIFQAEDRTLSSKEIDSFQKEIINTLEKNPQWEVRR